MCFLFIFDDPHPGGFFPLIFQREWMEAAEGEGRGVGEEGERESQRETLM